MFRRTPLRVKLVAAVLALVTAALAVIAVSSVVAMRQYLVGRVDEQLRDTADRIDIGRVLADLRQERADFPLPSNYIVGTVDMYGNARLLVDPSLSKEDLPRLPKSLGEVQKRVGYPYTVGAHEHGPQWRVLLNPLPNGEVLLVAQQLTEVDHAVGRLIASELVVGVIVLAVLAALGVALVRASLRPLIEIEHTAAAIAAGDLSQRVPESDPRTELGRLARALNAMLVQVEGAFTARAASERAARDSEERARRSEERMRQFVADASHELRTPLTSIRGFAELYRQGAAREPDQTEVLLGRIEDEAARMGLLVGDLLLLARLDQERPLELVPVELRVLATDAVAAARAVAPDRPIALELADEAERPAVVLGDEARLRQVLDNLMTNALTHTPPESPVTLRLTVDGDDAVLEVVDAGPGLSPEQAERVFERFYRVDKARTRRAASAAHTGAGLGLAIVAGLVAAHRGRVEVESAPGGGALFRVRLPLLALPVSSQGEPSSGEASVGTVAP